MVWQAELSLFKSLVLNDGYIPPPAGLSSIEKLLHVILLPGNLFSSCRLQVSGRQVSWFASG